MYNILKHTNESMVIRGITDIGSSGVHDTVYFIPEIADNSIVIKKLIITEANNVFLRFLDTNGLELLTSIAYLGNRHIVENSFMPKVQLVCEFDDITKIPRAHDMKEYLKTLQEVYKHIEADIVFYKSSTKSTTFVIQLLGDIDLRARVKTYVTLVCKTPGLF
jgi:hypothetical protein